MDTGAGSGLAYDRRSFAGIRARLSIASVWRCARLAVLLAWKRYAPPIEEMSTGPVEQQRAWRELTLAAERFHAAVIRERECRDDMQDPDASAASAPASREGE